MSYFQLKQYQRAVPLLKHFLEEAQHPEETQEARMALLLVYEKQKDWDSLLGLAAETDKTTLFQENRALLKLLWARALVEKGETKGARQVLQDAAPYMETGTGFSQHPFEKDKDLWGRYYFTSLLLKKSECDLTPKAIGHGKTQKYLYGPWLDSSVDCYRTWLGNIKDGLLKSESPWAEPALNTLRVSVQRFGDQVHHYLGLEQKHLVARRQLNSLARENLYRLLNKVDETMKDFKNQSVIEPDLAPLRKQLDLLLVSLASPF
jgi:hypothetical protein